MLRGPDHIAMRTGPVIKDSRRGAGTQRRTFSRRGVGTRGCALRDDERHKILPARFARQQTDAWLNLAYRALLLRIPAPPRESSAALRLCVSHYLLAASRSFNC